MENPREKKFVRYKEGAELYSSSYFWCASRGSSTLDARLLKK